MCNYIISFGNYEVQRLTRALAGKYVTKLTALASEIPLVQYTEQDIMAEAKANRVFYGKWQHSLVMLQQDIPVAFLMAYERKAEANTHYPHNSLYISELAVDVKHRKQGLAKKLLSTFLHQSTAFSFLSGPVRYTVQTNAAPWNSPVHRLYQQFGFRPASRKVYHNRADTIFTKP